MPRRRRHQPFARANPYEDFFMEMRLEVGGPDGLDYDERSAGEEWDEWHNAWAYFSHRADARWFAHWWLGHGLTYLESYAAAHAQRFGASDEQLRCVLRAVDRRLAEAGRTVDERPMEERVESLRAGLPA